MRDWILYRFVPGMLLAMIFLALFPPTSGYCMRLVLRLLYSM